MLDTLKNAWKVPDLRKRLFYTLMILLLFRLGSAIPVPFVSVGALKSMVGADGNLLGYIDLLTGGAFSQSTLFALSVGPYIQASIFMQLLAVAIPTLERMAKEGEEGRRKMQKITRYVGAGVALVLATMYYFLLRGQGALKYTTGFSGIFAAIVIIVSFVAGSLLIQWMGEQIDVKGIGNGISMLIFAGIVSGWGGAFSTIQNYLALAAEGETKYYFFIPLIAVLIVIVTVIVVILNAAERRIPVQYAKRVMGRKMYGGQNTHIPIKVNMSGVLPIIFASSLVSVPGTIGNFFPSLYDPAQHPILSTMLRAFNYNSWAYAIIYLMLIIAFNYFYVAIQYDPIEIANNLRNNNGTIPGYRPGKPTSDFITKVLGKITFVGALFLAVVAIMPIVLSNLLGINISLGGTSVLIVVGVALDTARSMESYLLMRHHKGFLE